MSRPDGAPRVQLRAVALRAAAGDEAAFTVLVGRTSGVIWRVCAALTDAGAAEDLVQETYLRAMRSLPGYRGDADPATWLVTIARRVCAEEIGRRQRARTVLRRLAAQTPEPNPQPMLLSDARDALDRLPAERREALLLTAVAGLSYAEAAQACGCPVGTIRSRVARARAHLIDMLELPGPPQARDEAR